MDMLERSDDGDLSTARPQTPSSMMQIIAASIHKFPHARKARARLPAMQNKPAYALQSVDAALRLVQSLQAFGPMRVSDVATELGVAVSTAHRLLAMLVYRGYAEQLPDRRYGPGPGLRPMPVVEPAVAELRERSRGPLVALVESIGESANVVVLSGVEVLFIATAECDRVLRVGDRAGQRLPAHLTSGGKAILAGLPDAELERFDHLDPPALTRLRRDVGTARLAGYATNHQDTERGLSAIGVALASHAGSTRAAVCLAMPTVRYRRASLDSYVAALAQAARRLEDALDDEGSMSSRSTP
jgi:IclR family transcriptional regulator, acetate operon repressor